nr:immunoglobulin heavy chain junction region [Macaca mulatta]MOX59534.1 immunoglobulin heavy chain junction region [Macaca mulatta]MOX60143.1 immunoglobulin heavy chain junction region [Macaca mulatta]MOX60357.1 immunoglobulin heavy chain junction region [Macaca mulatta]MOX61841.1 immunoglobulin heavy chain junction region [Macaca mulatta]
CARDDLGSGFDYW